MKKTLLLLMIFVTSLFAKSLNAQSYLDSTSTWYEYFGGADFIHYHIAYNTYFIDGDTIISGNNYYKFNLQHIPPQQNKIVIAASSLTHTNNESVLSRYIFLERKTNGWHIVFQPNNK